jgi:hypothetical protein
MQEAKIANQLLFEMYGGKKTNTKANATKAKATKAKAANRKPNKKAKSKTKP